ncbi:ATP-binding cassette domain-containing protein [Microtetraspora malaysiensis]|uniref:ATP-binding cassette domain-containing protein n=1 Tax=Microtetraspora malaysiensis TaxID=161358 RepID=UPI003D8A3DF0
MTYAIEAEGLIKRYGDKAALDGVNLTACPGEVLAVLGPNGAGKTTAVRILATLVSPDGGSARVGGHDVVARPRRVRELIGLTGQYASVDENLTGTQNLMMIGRLLGMNRADARARAVGLLDRFSLTEAGDRAARTYSGGMRRRLDLAVSMVADPRIIFMDEPTTGLDPRARTELWDIVREQVAGGSTVLLTTQYLEEADQLADRIVVIDHGRVTADGTPDQLKSRAGHRRLEIRPERDLRKAHDILAQVTGVTPHVTCGQAAHRPATAEPTDRRSKDAMPRPPGGTATAEGPAGGATEQTADAWSGAMPGRAYGPAEDGVLSVPIVDPAMVPEVFRRLEDAGITLTEHALRRPSLDEAFLALVSAPSPEFSTAPRLSTGTGGTASARRQAPSPSSEPPAPRPNVSSRQPQSSGRSMA